MSKVTLCVLIVASMLPLLAKAQSPAPLSSTGQHSIRGQTRIHGFPAPQEELLGDRDKQDIGAIRKHAWEVFSALTSKKSMPIWESWYTKCDVSLQPDICGETSRSRFAPPSLHGLEVPTQVLDSFAVPLHERKPDLVYDVPAFFQMFRKQPNFASVLFNPEAARHILATNINDATTLQNILKDRINRLAPVTETEIPPFPAGSIAVKTIWEELTPGKVSTELKLIVWDPDKLNFLEDRQTGGTLSHFVDDDTGVISVDPDRHLKCEDRDYLGKVPISCFHYLRVNTVKEGKQIGRIARLLQGTLGAPPYYLALVGVHIITKETPEWTWSTFYWSRKAYSDPKAVDHPQSLRGPWSHFVMDATLSPDTPVDIKSKGPNISYNPYMEGRISHGVSSNCLFCHGHASYTQSPDKRTGPNEIGSPEYFGGARHVTEDQEKEFFANALRTDFLWSIADISLADRHAEFLKELTLYLTLRHLE